MNRYLIMGHVCISLLYVFLIIKLRQHFGLSQMDWTFLTLCIVFYWLGVLTRRKKQLEKKK